MPKQLSLIAIAILLSACVQSYTTEQRIVQLPANNPNTSLATASRIGRYLLSGGLADKVRAKFPTLAPQQVQGIFVTWNETSFNGRTKIFLATGIRYTGSLHEAKEVADYCETLAKAAVAANFPN
jgi:hypothetical protein